MTTSPADVTTSAGLAPPMLQACPTTHLAERDELRIAALRMLLADVQAQMKASQVRE